MLLDYSAFVHADSARRQVELVEVAVIMGNDHHRCPSPHQLGQKLVVEFAPEFRILFRRPLIQQEDWALLEQAHNERKASALPAREVERTELSFCQAGFCIQPELKTPRYENNSVLFIPA